MAKAKKHRVRILRNTKIDGEIRRPGDIVTVGTIDYNTLLHFAKAEAVEEVPAGQGPQADERESELKARMSRRGRAPQAGKGEIVDEGKK
jgi:hypothetical protein